MKNIFQYKLSLIFIAALLTACGAKDEDKLPMKQSDFTKSIQYYCDLYMHQKNEMAKTNIRMQRKSYLENQSGKFINWTGEIRSISTRTNGNASLLVKMDQSPCSKIYFSFKLEPKHPSYNNFLSAKDKGDKVTLTGKIKIDNGHDFFDEDALIESTSMKAPNFIVEIKSANLFR